jgi:hypothetical protein
MGLKDPASDLSAFGIQILGRLEKEEKNWIN